MFTKNKAIIDYLNRYRVDIITAPSSANMIAAFKALMPLRVLEVVFDHTLNVPASVEVWPGDASELFFQEFFAVRLVRGRSEHCKQGPVFEHIRQEILRMCNLPEVTTLESIWVSNHRMNCFLFNGSFAYELFGKDRYSLQPHETNLDAAPFSNDNDDDEEPDTLNSELLLTEVYLSPAEVEALKSRPLGVLTLDSVSSSSVAAQTVGPQCRAETNQPTEQEE